MQVRRPLVFSLSLVIVGAWVARSAAPLRAEMSASDFPYIAYVVEPDSYVRSGPGREHYPTGQLPAGYAVEVHRHDGNGWCAVRPPEGSFSLAPLQQMKVVDQQTGTITGDGIVARVGSLLGDQRNAVQVMLERGEAVAILEPPSPTSPWVRIAPPAGEFRWIAARRLSRTPPTELKPLVAGSGGWQSHGAAVAARSIGRISPPEPTDDPTQSSGDQFTHLLTPPPGTSGAPSYAAASPQSAAPVWTPQPALVETAPASAVTAGYNANDVQVIAGSPAAAMQAQYQQPVNQLPTGALAAPPLMPTSAPAPDDSATPSPAPSSGQPRVRFEGLSAPVSGPLDPRVAEMQVRLSQIVVGAPTAWQFGPLREEAAALLAQEQSSGAREQLRDLLDRIATFETVQARYRGASPLGGAALAGATTPAGAAPTAGAPAGAALATTDASDILNRVRNDLGRGVDNGVTPTPGAAQPATQALYDAVGTLKPVVSKRSGAPQFALIDDHGDVVTFVTSSPDVNLQSYVGKRIGVRGSRGFMPEYRRAHVTASRVTPLEQTMIK